MKDIFTAPFVVEMMKTTANMYRLGWDERNGGKLLNINSKYELSSADDFVSLIVLDGELAVKWDNDSFNAKKGDSIFVPNGVAVLLEGKAQLLVSK